MQIFFVIAAVVIAVMAACASTTIPFVVAQEQQAVCGGNVNVTSTSSPIGVAMINTILKMHNDARANVNPPAKFMPLLQWNEDLAKNMRDYLLTCPSPGQHSSQSQWRLDKFGFKYIGENLGYSSSTTATSNDFPTFVNMWINEKSAWQYTAATCSENSVCGTCTPTSQILSCGHYTQVVWNKTQFVGCAAVTNADCNSGFLAGCMYGSGGNLWRQGPFESTSDGKKISCAGGTAAPPPPAPVPPGSTTTTTATAPPPAPTGPSPSATTAMTTQQQTTAAVPATTAAAPAQAPTASTNQAVCGGNVNVTSSANSPMSVAMINTILKMHNDARANVNPPAKFMPLLQWNEDLAKNMRDYLLTCPSPGQHSSQSQWRLDKFGFKYIGENLGYSSSTTATSNDFPTFVNMWINEKSAWQYTAATCSENSVCGTCTPTSQILSCGHYTQVVWNKTQFVGCAAVPNSVCGGGILVGCMYGSGGNLWRQGPFESTSDGKKVSCSGGGDGGDGAAAPVADAGNGGMIAGIVVAVICVGIGVAVFVLWRKNQQSAAGSGAGGANSGYIDAKFENKFENTHANEDLLVHLNQSNVVTQPIDTDQL